jgi:hypothetical protein
LNAPAASLRSLVWAGGSLTTIHSEISPSTDAEAPGCCRFSSGRTRSLENALVANAADTSS